MEHQRTKVKDGRLMYRTSIVSKARCERTGSPLVDAPGQDVGGEGFEFSILDTEAVTS